MEGSECTVWDLRPTCFLRMEHQVNHQMETRLIWGSCEAFRIIANFIRSLFNVPFSMTELYKEPKNTMLETTEFPQLERSEIHYLV